MAYGGASRTSMVETGIGDKRTTTMMMAMARIILMMSILLILNMMAEKLVFVDGCVAIVKEWVIDVRYATTMMLLVRLNLRYLLLMVNIIPMHTLLGRLLLIQNLHVMNFLRIKGLGLQPVSSLILVLCGG